MIDDKVVSLLQTTELFKGLSGEEIQKVVRLAFIREFSAGYRLFGEGTKGEAMFVVLGGEVRLMKGEKTVATLRAGEFLGEMALIENQARTASAVVSQNANVLVITQKAFQEIMDAEARITSKILMRFLKVLSERLRQATSH